MDKIYFNRMEFYGYHGVYGEENRLGQRFLVDLELSLDLSLAAKTDDLNDTVNYADIYDTTQKIMEGPPCQLVETLCEKIAQAILGQFDPVEEVMVRVIKPDPPIPGHYQSVGVEISRKKGR
ncbi:MAG: dihydroneopterin aldolase [Bacillaceae bacterium]|nr:dihydroneopterin aldolase [Bacillaceae bacterium]